MIVSRASLETQQKPNFIDPSILLDLNIPKPLHGLNPRTLLGKEWWDKERKAAQAKNNYCCWACGVYVTRAKYHAWLEGHEIYDRNYEDGVFTYKHTASLCHACHNYIHDGRMQALVDKGVFPSVKQNYIINHGEAILKRAKLKRPAYPSTSVLWKEWKLVINKQAYPPLTANYEDWYLKYYGCMLAEPELAELDLDLSDDLW